MKIKSIHTAFVVHKSFSSIINLYDAFILDQFGVLHNGKSSLPGAERCIKEMSSNGKRMIILSNTSSPSETAMAKLLKIGYDPNDFHGAVTSGEEASRYIRERFGSGDCTKKALWFTWDEEDLQLEFLKRCGNTRPANSIDEADFIIAHGSKIVRRDEIIEGTKCMKTLGSFMNDGDFAAIDPILEQCQQRSLPMVCANPDFIVMMSDGSVGHMPGKIAKRYEEMGGTCKFFGKPHVSHFKACLEKLGIDRERVAHVGDSLHHDVAGANAAGIASIFVTGGIHCDDLGGQIGVLPSKEVLDSFFQHEGHFPTHVVPMLKF